MNKTLLISTSNKEFINKYIDQLLLKNNLVKNNNPDILFIEPNNIQSIGIKQTKELKKWAELKPFHSENKIGIIENAHLLTIEAQNSILKLLEEPNPSLIILLITDNYKKLLPTIISRCELIEDSSEKFFNKNNNYSNFTQLNMLDRLEIIDNILNNKNKNILIQELLLSLLINNRNNLSNKSKLKITLKNIDLIHETNFRILKNVSKRLALENLIINLV